MLKSGIKTKNNLSSEDQFFILALFRFWVFRKCAISSRMQVETLRIIFACFVLRYVTVFYWFLYCCTHYIIFTKYFLCGYYTSEQSLGDLHSFRCRSKLKKKNSRICSLYESFCSRGHRKSRRLVTQISLGSSRELKMYLWRKMLPQSRFHIVQFYVCCT